jgi:hypothetical protein
MGRTSVSRGGGGGGSLIGSGGAGAAGGMAAAGGAVLAGGAAAGDGGGAAGVAGVAGATGAAAGGTAGAGSVGGNAPLAVPAAGAGVCATAGRATTHHANDTSPAVERIITLSRREPRSLADFSKADSRDRRAAPITSEIAGLGACYTSMNPSKKSAAGPAMRTRFSASTSRHHRAPPRAETWRANSVVFPSRLAQNGIKRVCADPVT